MLTVRDEADVATRGLDLGVIDYIPKDVFSETVLLESEPAVEPVSRDGARAEIEHYALNEIRIDATLPKPAILVVSEVFYPRWQAFVDGEETETIRANYILRALALPAGDHEIVFRYDSSLVRKGLMITLSALVAMVLIIVAAAFGGRRARAAEV